MKIEIDGAKCLGCGTCVGVCPQKILAAGKKETARVLDSGRCLGCFGCEDECPAGAIRVVRGVDPDAAPSTAVPPKRDRYDAVVIGAGPAGLAAAWTLAEAGRSVAVFDRLPDRNQISHPDGGVLAPYPGGRPVRLNSDGLFFPDADLLLPTGDRVGLLAGAGLIGPDGRGTGSAFPKKLAPFGVQCSKTHLNRVLADRAESAGAELVYRAPVAEIVNENGRTVGARLTGGSEIAADVVIAAEGIHGKLSARAGLPTNRNKAGYAAVAAYEYEADPDLSRQIVYFNGRLDLEPGMPPALAGFSVGNSAEISLICLYEKRFYPAPRPMDHYLDAFIKTDPRLKKLTGGRFAGRRPDRMHGCRVLFRQANRDAVRPGLISVGDAVISGGELGNVGALTHGVTAGRTAADALRRGDVSQKSLAPAARFITDRLVKGADLNGYYKTLPRQVSEEDMIRFYQVMRHVNYPTMVFGSPPRQGLMFTGALIKGLGTLIRHPRLFNMLMGK